MTTLELNDTTLSVVIEARRIPETETVQISPGAHYFPYILDVKVFVGGKQLEFLSRFEISMDSSRAVPEVRAELVGGQKLDLLPEDIRQKVEETLNLLRQFPFVKIN